MQLWYYNHYMQRININLLQKGVTVWKYHKQLPVILSTTTSILKKNTARNYEATLSRFNASFADRELASLTPEEILSFLTQFNPTVKQSTKRLRYIYVKGFFNFCVNTLDEALSNPCNTLTLRKMFRDKKEHRGLF